MAPNTHEHDRLSETDTWALAHIARFPRMPSFERDDLIASLSAKGKRIAHFILHPDERGTASPDELATVEGILDATRPHTRVAI